MFHPLNCLNVYTIRHFKANRARCKVIFVISWEEMGWKKGMTKNVNHEGECGQRDEFFKIFTPNDSEIDTRSWNLIEPFQQFCAGRNTQRLILINPQLKTAPGPFVVIQFQIQFS
jgi:hypothetical protein